jgi:UDP-glucose 4-epimerase
MQQILITGGAGFIGSHLTEAYLARGAAVTVIDDLSTGVLANLRRVNDKVTILTGELLTALTESPLRVEEFDLIFHLAGNGYVPPSVTDPHFDFRSNLETTFILLERLRLARKRPKLIYASTAAVYGDPQETPITEETPLLPISPYGVSKLASERYLAVYSALYGIPATSLRFFSVFGPRLRKQVIYDLLVKLTEKQNSLEVLGDGTQERDFVFVSDLVAALMLIAEVAPMQGEAYNVASGSSVTIRELIRSLCKVLQIEPTINFTGSVRPGDAQRWIVNIERLQQLGYQPSVGLETGLALTCEWFRNEYAGLV